MMSEFRRLHYTASSLAALFWSTSRCPVLEYFLLNGSFGFRCLRINSPSLKSVAISSGELIIEDAPLLQRLLQLQPCGVLNVSVISAPKVETLGCLGYDSTLLFGTSVIQVTSCLHEASHCITACTKKICAICIYREPNTVFCLLKKSCAVSFTTVVSSVKILAICLYSLNLDMVINLMRCFPCLEKLYILVVTKLIQLFILFDCTFLADFYCISRSVLDLEVAVFVFFSAIWESIQKLSER